MAIVVQLLQINSMGYDQYGTYHNCNHFSTSIQNKLNQPHLDVSIELKI